MESKKKMSFEMTVNDKELFSVLMVMGAEMELPEVTRKIMQTPNLFLTSSADTSDIPEGQPLEFVLMSLATGIQRLIELRLPILQKMMLEARNPAQAATTNTALRTLAQKLADQAVTNGGGVQAPQTQKPKITEGMMQSFNDARKALVQLNQVTLGEVLEEVKRRGWLNMDDDNEVSAFKVIIGKLINNHFVKTAKALQHYLAYATYVTDK